MATPSVPVIDLSNFEQRQEEITDQIIRAAKEIGFLQVINHGIDAALIDKIFAAAARCWSIRLLRTYGCNIWPYFRN